MHSCIYRGQVRHRRLKPAHRFQYATSWVYLDLDEAEEVVCSRWILSDRRFAPASFRRDDHLGDPNVPMKESVYRLVEEQTGLQLSGPVRLLTQLRHFGLYFSPINVFYCYDDQDTVIAMVAEVSNTPWNERHCYVLWEGNRRPDSTNRYSHPKEFHVSPFMGMDSRYDWKIRARGRVCICRSGACVRVPASSTRTCICNVRNSPRVNSFARCCVVPSRLLILLVPSIIKLYDFG